jgi:hypothetical protein
VHWQSKGGSACTGTAIYSTLVLRGSRKLHVQLRIRPLLLLEELYQVGLHAFNRGGLTCMLSERSARHVG